VNRSIPGIEVDGQRVITYKEAMLLPEQPRELVVIGAGAIGLSSPISMRHWARK